MRELLVGSHEPELVGPPIPRGRGGSEASFHGQLEQGFNPNRIDRTGELPALLEFPEALGSAQEGPAQHGHLTVTSVGALRHYAHLEPGRVLRESSRGGDGSVSHPQGGDFTKFPRRVVRRAHIDQDVAPVAAEVIDTHHLFGCRRGQHDDRALLDHVLPLAERAEIAGAVDPHRTVHVLAERLGKARADGDQSLLDLFRGTSGEVDDVAPHGEEQNVSHADHASSARDEDRTLVDGERVQVQSPHPFFRLGVRNRYGQGIAVGHEDLAQELESRQDPEDRAEEPEHVLHVPAGAGARSCVCSHHDHVRAIPQDRIEHHVEHTDLCPPLPLSHLCRGHEDRGGVRPDLLVARGGIDRVDFRLGGPLHEPARVHEVSERHEGQNGQGEELDDRDQPLVGAVLIGEVGALVVPHADGTDGENATPVHVGPEVDREDPDADIWSASPGLLPAHQPGVGQVEDVPAEDDTEETVQHPGVLVVTEGEVEGAGQEDQGDASDEGAGAGRGIPFGAAGHVDSSSLEGGERVRMNVLKTKL